MNESWESVWAQKRDSGFLSRMGKAMAARCDLQFLVHKELMEWCAPGNDSRILEIGCGTAPVPGMLRSRTDLLYGVDVSFSSAKVSSSLCASAVADGRKLPFPGECFDTVFSTGVLDLYDLDEVHEFFLEILRVLKPGGRTVIITSRRECSLHRIIMKHLEKKGRWKYGPKRSFTSLSGLIPHGMHLLSEHGRGAVFQLRFVSYLFEDRTFIRRLYNGLFLCVSLLLRPLNDLPGALLVTVLEKK